MEQPGPGPARPGADGEARPGDAGPVAQGGQVGGAAGEARDGARRKSAGAAAAPRGLRLALDRVLAASHALRGTRGLLLGAVGLLLLTLLEPALPPATDLAWLVAPVLVVLANGLATLPREGVTLQHRAVAVLAHGHPEPQMRRRLAYIVALDVLLLPRIFLAAYGVPSLNPLTGLVSAGILARVSVTFVFVVLLLPILYLRSNRRYAPHLHPQRPKDLPPDHPDHRTRDLLVLQVAALVLGFALLLRPFWSPFTLLEWPPSLASLNAGPAGVHRLAFALLVPVLLFLTVAAHAQLLFRLGKDGWRARRGVAGLAAAHIALSLLGIALHAYDLLWIVRYQSMWNF
ncbi:MAG TPA: hypothetical protein VFH47_02265 [Candidatus Thermoplasmatota archaeon]|nr:hypothetical protein [Candidatus Thermoplasmatota archaeon]